MATLQQVTKPYSKLSPDHDPGEPISRPYHTSNGWTFTGYRDERGRYYECARRAGVERWFILSDDE